MPVDMGSMQQMLMDRLQEQISSPPVEQPQADSQQVSQFQNELGPDAGIDAKNAGTAQPVDGSQGIELQAMQNQALTPGDRILANMSSPGTSGVGVQQVTPASDVTGDGVNSLVNAQMKMTEITLNSSLGVNSFSSTSQGFESLLRSS